MKTSRVLLVLLAILALSSTAAFACGPYEWALPFGNTQGGDSEVSRTGHLPTIHEQEDSGTLVPMPLPLEEAGEIIIQILRTALV
jgi:hypothetical protein